MIKRSRIVPLIFFITLLFVFVIYLKNNVFQSKGEEIPADAQFVNIPTNSNFEEVVQILTKQGLIQNPRQFETQAQKN